MATINLLLHAIANLMRDILFNSDELFFGLLC
jgi:hypothetical protein